MYFLHSSKGSNYYPLKFYFLFHPPLKCLNICKLQSLQVLVNLCGTGFICILITYRPFNLMTKKTPPVLGPVLARIFRQNIQLSVSQKCCKDNFYTQISTLKLYFTFFTFLNRVTKFNNIRKTFESNIVQMLMRVNSLSKIKNLFKVLLTKYEVTRQQ